MTPDPEQIKSGFCSNLIRHNRLELTGFREWLFYPGMLFSSGDKWWGDQAGRDCPHEGLDFCLFRDYNDRTIPLGCGVLVPVMYDGEVVRVIDDFLGKTIFVRHRAFGNSAHDFYTVYGHISPHDRVVRSLILSEGELIGSIADTSGSRSGLPPHLHISVALISKELDEGTLDWAVMRDPRRVRLRDPLPFLDCRFAVTGIGG